MKNDIIQASGGAFVSPILYRRTAKTHEMITTFTIHSVYIDMVTTLHTQKVDGWRAIKF